MGILKKLLKKQEPAPEEDKKRKPTLKEDIKTGSEWFVQAMDSSGYRLDWTIESFHELDRFFDEQKRPGGILDGKVGTKLFAAASYVGETIIKEVGGVWETDDSDPQGELNIAVRLRSGGVIWPVQRVMKRFENGAEDSLYAYGCVLKCGK